MTQTTSPLSDENPQENGPPPSLLIVEDDPAFLRTLSRSFERRGYTVSAATSASR